MHKSASEASANKVNNLASPVVSRSEPIKRKKKAFWIPLLLIICLPAAFFITLEILLGNLNIFLPYTAELTGFGQERNYLILLQNNNELRPTGGFISAYGILKLKNGQLNLEFADSYSLTNTAKLPPAPEPFNVLIKNDPKFKGWYFRDGNFNPDFPESVNDLLKLYKTQSGQENTVFDGVFAVNFEFLEDLVEIYKPQLKGTPLTRENLFSFLEYQVKNIDTHNISMLENRKNALKDLSQILIEKFKWSPLKYGQLFGVINQALNQKKILLFFKNPKLQALAESKNWAGQFNPATYNNFVYTNIANILGRKSDRYVRKTHDYFLKFNKDGTRNVRYSLELSHLGTANLNSDTYKAYIRIFVPKTAKKCGYFDAYVNLEPNEKKTITIDYTLLPPSKSLPQNKPFGLDLIKQPGTKDFWQISIQLPDDNSLKSDEFDIKENIATWSGYLEQDKHFDFKYLKDTTPPIVLWQKFNEQNLIEVGFSEELSEKSASNPENFEISDLNHINKDTDHVTIKSAHPKQNSLFLETEGISEAPKERYKLILKNLQDNYGNATNPRSLTITVVQ